MMFGNFAQMGTGTAIFWLHLHWVFVGTAIFAFVAAIIWLTKYATKNDFMKTLKWTLAVGILGILLTAPFSLSGWSLMMSSHRFGGGFGGYGMMQNMFQGCGLDGNECTYDEMLEHMNEYFNKTGSKK